MDLQQTLNNIGQLLVQVLYAVVVLFVGWVIAKVVAVLIGKLLHWLRLDERVGKAAGETKVPQLEKIITLAAYYLILLFAVVAALQVLGLTIITQPLNSLLNAIFAYVPNLIAGGVIIFVAWLVATILRAIVRGFLESTKMDKRIGEAADVKDWPLARAIGEVVYWLVWLLFLPIIFAAFGLTALIAPVMNLLSQLLGWIPNLIVAAIIVVVGWFIARIVQRIAVSFFVALGTDKLSDRVGLSKYMGKMTLSALIGLIIFVLIMIPIIIAALEALNLSALTAPLVAMLTAVMTAIPVIIIAVLVIIVAYFVGRVVGDFVASLLAGLGFDNILIKLGLAKEGAKTTRTPSQVVGWLVMIAIILGAALAAFTMLRLDPLAQLLSDFIVFCWQIIMGLLIFGVGLWIAGWVSNFVLESNWPRKYLLALVGRIAVIVLSLAMALTAMGLANSIITLAFGVPLIGVALAIGLAFGLGGKDVAAKQLEQWQTSMKDVDEKLAAQTPETPDQPQG
ncbi:MAG TPA: mechanosensitive ion channel [Anaerolineae bacterium]|nr:mechanosensitive ion channel [Anaerolineae bacterium]